MRRREEHRAVDRPAPAAFWLAAVLLGMLCWFARGPLLWLSLWVTGPLPTVRTALLLSREEEQPATAVLPQPEESLFQEAEATSEAPDVEAYFAVLETDAEKPADAGSVLEKSYPQGSGEKYIACGAGSIKNNTRVPAAEAAAALGQPLPFAVEWDSPEPQVLILHTHATETYRMAEGLWYRPGDGARTTERERNMCAVGRVMADTLNAAGLNTLHDESLNDYPSYTGSYANSRAVAQRYLEQYPSIKVILDVHRDAIETEAGARYAPVCTVGGRQAAQVMIICGCDNGSSVRLPDWRQNLCFAGAWENAMETLYPGFTRPVLFSYRFYNQDLTAGSLLIEIGGHGNNLNEAIYAGQLAANGLLETLRP